MDHEDRQPHRIPTGHGDEVELAIFSPKMHQTHFPSLQITGYLLSIILTLLAFGMVAYHWMPMSSLIPVILILAFIQAGLQLGIFMHLREGRGTTWQIPVLALAVSIGLGIVGFSIWIMMFKSGVS